MKNKLSLLIAVFAVIAFSTGIFAAPAPCKAKKFETEIAKKACEKGGQAEAKKAWKAWVNENKAKYTKGKLNCKTCHQSITGDYKLKADAAKTYKELGGK